MAFPFYWNFFGKEFLIKLSFQREIESSFPKHNFTGPWLCYCLFKRFKVWVDTQFENTNFGYLQKRCVCDHPFCPVAATPHHKRRQRGKTPEGFKFTSVQLTGNVISVRPFTENLFNFCWTFSLPNLQDGLAFCDGVRGWWKFQLYHDHWLPQWEGPWPLGGKGRSNHCAILKSVTFKKLSEGCGYHIKIHYSTYGMIVYLTILLQVKYLIDMIR